MLVCILLLAIPVAAQDNPTPTAVPHIDLQFPLQTEWEVVGVVIRSKITNELILVPFASLVTPTPTNTPVSSVTPTPTNTPVQTTEPPTPTPEVTVLPPTFTSTPEPKECVVKVGSFAINERVDHYATSAKTSTSPIPASSTVKVEQFWQASTTPKYLWGKSYTGWFVVGELLSTGTMDWWVYGVTNTTELCDEVPGWPTGLAPPTAIVHGGPFSTDAALVGPHFTYSIQESLVRQSAPYWTIVKCLVGAAHSCSVALDTQPGTVYVYRDVRIENPTDAELAYGAQSYAQRVLAVCDVRADYCEIMNERPMTHEQYSWLSDFLVGVGEEFNRAGRCMLAPAFAPGHPDLNQREWTPLVKWLQWANEHPCGTWPDGSLKFHGLSWHAAAYAPDWVDISRWPWVNWIFVAGNAILGNQQMIEDTGFGIQDFLGPKIVSELGFSDGYAGTPDQDASCDIKRALIQETARIYALHSDIFDAFNWWNIGVYAGGGWVDDSHCLPGLFQ